MAEAPEPVRIMIRPELDPNAVAQFRAELEALAADAVRILADAVATGLRTPPAKDGTHGGTERPG